MELLLVMAGVGLMILLVLPRNKDRSAKEGDAFEEGWEARVHRAGSNAIPCPPGGPGRAKWKQGWAAADRHLEQEDEKRAFEEEDTDKMGIPLPEEEPESDPSGEDPPEDDPRRAVMVTAAFLNTGKMVQGTVKKDGSFEVTSFHDDPFVKETRKT